MAGQCGCEQSINNTIPPLASSRGSAVETMSRESVTQGGAAGGRLGRPCDRRGGVDQPMQRGVEAGLSMLTLRAFRAMLSH